MPRTFSSIDKIRAELAWVNEPVDPTRCGCRHAQCCKDNGHEPGGCGGAVASKLWTFRLEYFCATCPNMSGAARRFEGIWPLAERPWEERP
jgi:hypothetical protein